MNTAFLLIAASSLPGLACASSLDTPKELGAIQWQRKLEPALEASARSHKPLLLLFQEVPG